MHPILCECEASSAIMTLEALQTILKSNYNSWSNWMTIMCLADLTMLRGQIEVSAL